MKPQVMTEAMQIVVELRMLELDMRHPLPDSARLQRAQLLACALDRSCKGFLDGFRSRLLWYRKAGMSSALVEHAGARDLMAAQSIVSSSRASRLKGGLPPARRKI